MELIFLPNNLTEDLMNLCLEDIESGDLESIKNDLKEIDNDYLLKEVNLGEGADWILLLAIFTGLTNIFLLGNKIETGIEGWVKIGKRIKNIFTKSDRVYIDKDIATLMALLYLSDKQKIKSIKKILESTIPINDLSKMLKDRKSGDFIAQPYAVYLMTFEINNHLIVTIGVRSDGKIAEHYKFDKNDFIPF